MLSSLKKSERSYGIRENLGTLIFETPPKGSAQSHYRADSNRFFYERIEVSPTPLQFGELECNEFGFHENELPEIIE